MPRARQPRLSLEPLIERYGNVSVLARALGVNRTQVAHWRSDGLPLDAADRVAVLVGKHPAEVWPEWYRLSSLLDDEAA